MGAPSPPKPVERPLVFALNGKRVQVPTVDPATTLLHYIRTEAGLRGTKRGCGEGGCGACVVLLSRYNSQTKEVKEITINSCLVLLCSVDGCAITTTEGLGNQRDGFHTIHKRLSAFHASQCGFCTPGMTMAIYGCLKNDQNKKSQPGANPNGVYNGDHEKPDSKSKPAAISNGFHNRDSRPDSGLTIEKLERAVGGNLCRCTGYRPILDACKTFACDVDLEDLGLNTCWTDAAHAKPEQLPKYDPSEDPAFPKFLVEELEAREFAKGQGVDKCEGLAARFRHVETSVGEGEKERVWVNPSSMAEVFDALKIVKGRGEAVKLVVGNTSTGIYKDIKPEVFVDISQNFQGFWTLMKTTQFECVHLDFGLHLPVLKGNAIELIPELLAVHQDARGIEVGAAISIADLIDILEGFAGTGNKEPTAQCLADHLKKLASGHVRNWGSVGGNLVMAQQLAFDSDLATILLGAGAWVKVVTWGGHHPSVKAVSLEDFLAKGFLEEVSLVQSISIPLSHDSEPSESNGLHSSNGGKSSHSRTIFKTFRASPRPSGNAVAYVNAAFLARVCESQGQGTLIESLRLAFGAFGTKHAVRASRVEEFLKGKTLTPGVLLEAIELLKKEIVPRDGTTKAEFRASLAVGFLFQFLNPLLSSEPMPIPATISPHSGKQLITAASEKYMHQPAPKLLAELQASGEAIYVDDIPSPEKCLYAAFVLSSEPLAKIESVDTQAAMNSLGAEAYISARDVPPGGQNMGISTFLVSEKYCFAEDLVECVGQPVGLMIADTYDHAKTAADKVKVVYDTESVGAPILTYKEAVARDSTYPVHFLFASELFPIGDAAKCLEEAEFQVEGEVATNSQQPFYMETQTTLVVPDEDGSLTVYTAAQSPDNVQTTISAILGLPNNKVRVVTRRVGGAFGGKAFRNIPIAAACALASYRLRRPVRISLDRNTDMQLVAGRSPTNSKFTVGFTKEGKITGLKIHTMIEAGWTGDASTFIPGSFNSNLKKYNWGAYDFKYTVCRTNQITKSLMRAPGDVDGSFVADAIIEQVAAYLGTSSDSIRDKNLHTDESIVSFYTPKVVGELSDYTLPDVWAQLKRSSNKAEREQEIERFNEQNKWIKRGLGMVPSIYSIIVFGSTATVSIFQDGSIVAEVGGVEIGQGLYTKVAQAVAFSLCSLWPEEQGMDMMSKIRVLQADSLNLIHGGITGGSSTSEGSCAAVQLACATLVERLLPVKTQLEKGQPDGILPWENLCTMARMMQVDMQSHARWSPPMSFYLTYGAAVSEVEVNVLTGETRILATDILYDCGKSLNPAVDIGQAEGAFVQGVGFFLTEEVQRDSKGKLISDGTWLYKVPTVDNIPKQFNVEFFDGPVHKDRVLSSKASGEPPLSLAGSIYAAIYSAIRAARKDLLGANATSDVFRLDVPASLAKVKKLCGVDNVERHLQSLAKSR